MQIRIVNEKWIQVFDGEGNRVAQFLGTREDVEDATRYNAMPRYGYVATGRGPADQTEADMRVLDAIRRHFAVSPIAPTMRELAILSGIRSTNTIKNHVERLAIAGLIYREPRRARGIHLIEGRKP